MAAFLDTHATMLKFPWRVTWLPLTIAIDPAVLEAAQREAEHRNITVDQLVADSLATIVPAGSTRKHDNSALLRLMERGPLGDIGKPLTREEIYAERTWPRS